MKKTGKIYPPPRYFIIINFLKSLRKNRLYFILYILYFIFLFYLPGQNYYQTLTAAYQNPQVRIVPISYPLPAPYPILIGFYPKELTAEGIIIMDIPSGVILYSKNPNLPLTPASTTKIMTAIIALENYNLNDILTVKNLITDGATMGLEIGDKLTVENLLYGLLINSGNDAAFVLADNFKGGVKNFIVKMNQKAKELNLNNTHFNNVSGLEETNHYTTAFDLARLTTYALNNSFFLKIVSIPEITVPNYNFTKWYRLKNINKLLSEIPGVFGVKTGYTEEAGECLITTVWKNQRKILIVILKSKDRFGETTYLIDWVFNNFYWQEIK